MVEWKKGRSEGIEESWEKRIKERIGEKRWMKSKEIIEEIKEGK